MVLLSELHAVLQLLLLHGQQFTVWWDPVIALVSDLTIDAPTHNTLLGTHDLLLQLWVIICASKVQVRVAGQLWNGLGLPLACLGHDDTRKILIWVSSSRFFRWLVVNGRSAVVAACLVPWGLLNLMPMQKLILLLFSALISTVQIVWVVLIASKDFRPILRWNYFLLLLSEDRPMLGWHDRTALDIIHLKDGSFWDLLLGWFNRGNSHNTLTASDSTVRSIVKTDNSITTGIAVELRCDLYGRTCPNTMVLMMMISLLLLQLIDHALRVSWAGYLHDEARRLLTFLLSLTLSTRGCRGHLKWHD